jgi:hypothetical protein
MALGCARNQWGDGILPDRADRAGYDARAELANQGLYKRIRADLALGFFLTLRAGGSVKRRSSTARWANDHLDFELLAEPFGQRGFQLGDLGGFGVLRHRHAQLERGAFERD